MNRLIAWLRINDVTTGSSGAYPELQPLDLAVPPGDAYALAVATARQMMGWRIVAEAPHDGWFGAEATTSLLRFVDDIRVWVEARTGGGSLVRVRSRSRIGCGDFGTNARRIQTFLRLVGNGVETSPR